MQNNKIFEKKMKFSEWKNFNMGSTGLFNFHIPPNRKSTHLIDERLA